MKIDDFCTETLKIQKLHFMEDSLSGITLGDEKPPLTRCERVKMWKFWLRFSLIQSHDTLNPLWTFEKFKKFFETHALCTVITNP